MSGEPLSTRSFIARPTQTGYDGIYVHLDGTPSEKLPMLLAAFQHKFGRDVEAMAQHLVDGVTVGWDELGTDLFYGAPHEIVSALTGGQQWASRTLDHLITPDGSPPVRMTVTEETAADQDVQWGYILRPHGIEVIPVPHAEAGPVIGWDTDPRTAFSNHPGHWSYPVLTPGPSARAVRPPRSAPAAALAESRPAVRR
ncbi:hypothetical protein GTY89_05835 [Streptomyces sp. SID5471]|nr:hypothetical protein [Streptomyces sp. SID5471]QDA09263.1 hypothetical protein CTZ40_03280 [Streptomyces rimosus]QEV80546.1 hypothetical protein CP984_03270 [Streptomyces rimosus]QGY71609.1 hypothetical protein V519_024370 [Streptomyces rimosus R6-500]QTL91338.1 hypothetical protein FMM49_03830 [Streptomyces rimosus subsp. rimosus]